MYRPTTIQAKIDHVSRAIARLWRHVPLGGGTAAQYRREGRLAARRAAIYREAAKAAKAATRRRARADERGR